jgi:8-oxo-dGTP pyrophosphatase MutT (NUDIX family)
LKDSNTEELKESNTEKSKPKFPIVEQISAGGVAFRRTGAEIEAAIVAVNPSRRWQLPKGIIDAGETPEIAALREVREEAGIETELLELIEKVEYWYVGFHKGERVRFHKFVYFYLLRYLRGDVEDHDHEIAEARWTSIPEAIEMLAFKSEKEVVKKAFDKIKTAEEI